MKKIIIVAMLLCFGTDHLFAGNKLFLIKADTSDKANLPQLLSLYYDVKNALVAGNAETAAKKAAEFVKAINGIDASILSTADHKVFTPLQPKLTFDATHISESKDIEHQREHFENFSANMFTLAKGVKLSLQPVYEQYCPMKKAYWLSNESAIKNPYYGNSMLTCGKIAETIQ